MRSKLNVACAFMTKQRRKVNGLKKDLLKALDYKRFNHRRIVKQLRLKLSMEKRSQMDNYLKKIDRYEKLQAQMDRMQSDSQFEIPASIAHYKSLKALDPLSNCQKPCVETPTIYDDLIVLSKEQLSLLSRGI